MYMALHLHLAWMPLKNQYNNDNTGGAIRSFFMPSFANSSDRTISHIKREGKKRAKTPEKTTKNPEKTSGSPEKKGKIKNPY